MRPFTVVYCRIYMEILEIQVGYTIIDTIQYFPLSFFLHSQILLCLEKCNLHAVALGTSYYMHIRAVFLIHYTCAQNYSTLDELRKRIHNSNTAKPQESVLKIDFCCAIQH